MNGDEVTTKWEKNLVVLVRIILVVDAAKSTKRLSAAAENLSYGRINMMWDDILEGLANVSPVLWFLLGYLIVKVLFG